MQKHKFVWNESHKKRKNFFYFFLHCVAMVVFVSSTKKLHDYESKFKSVVRHHTLADECTVLRLYPWREVEAIKSTFHSTHTKRWYPSISQSLSTSQIKLPSRLFHRQHSTVKNRKRKNSEMPSFLKWNECIQSSSLFSSVMRGHSLKKEEKDLLTVDDLLV